MMSPSISSISARIGVIPIPPATSSTFSWRREASVKTPNGPSATTRVPGLEPIDLRRVAAEVLDRDAERLAVGRRRERERQRRPPEALGQEAPAEELARRGAHLVEPAARRCAARRRPGPSFTTSEIRSRWRNALMSGTATRQATSTSVEDVEAAPVPLGRRDVDQVVPGRDLVEPAERDAGVRGDVDRVPELVGDAPAHEDERGRRPRGRAERCRPWRRSSPG